MNKDTTSVSSTRKVRLSQSQLWTFQKEFYDQEGTDAWCQKIPFFSTSNVFIAQSYANILIRFMQDWMKHSQSDKQPFYILELGTGTGLFGFYLLKQLLDLRTQLDLPEMSFVYVMSDFVEKNICFWRKHPALREFVEDGILGFARFEAGVSNQLEIELKGIPGSQIIDEHNPTSKPLIGIVNYVFDSLPCDVFSIFDGQLQEGLTRSNIRPNTNPDMNLGAVMDEAGFDFTYQDTEIPYYQDERYDAILAGYWETFREANFLFPIGALDCVKSLMQLSRGRMFLIATDKAYGKNHELYITQKPDIVLHNTAFSVTVNFHAIGEYAQLYNGACHHQSSPSQINTSVFTLGFDLSRLNETRKAAEYYIDVTSPSHLLNIYTNFERVKDLCTVEEIISYLSLLHWDPYVVNSCFELLQARFEQLSYITATQLMEGLHRSAEMFYYIPGSLSVLNNIGTFLQAIGQYEVALHYYRMSIDYFGKQDFTCYNMGLCYFFLKDYDAALDAFKEAQSLGYQDNILLKGWIIQTQEEMAID